MENSQGLARRAACDRCRGQKLRCVRLSHSNAAKCKRCESAGTTCHYSISKPAGRPSGNGPVSNASSSSVESLVGIDAASGKKPNENERGPRLSRPGSRREKRPSDTTMRNEELDDVPEPLESAPIDQTPNNAGTFAPDDMPWPPTERPTTEKTNGWQANQQTIIIPPVFNDADMGLPGFSGEGRNWWCYDSTLGDTTSPPTPWESLGQTGPTHSYPWTTMPWDSINRDHGQSGIAPHHRHSMGAESTINAPISTDLLGGKDDCYSHSLAPDGSLMDIERTDTWVDRNSVSSHKENATGPHMWMQQFSELNLRLYELASANSSLERDMSCGAKLALFPTQLTGQVIDISSAFLDLLCAVGSRAQKDGGIAGKDQISSKEEQIRLGNNLHSFADFSSESSGDEQSDVELRPRGNKNRRFQRDPEESGIEISGKNMSPFTDITTLLQLLACYLRLRDLHGILYAAIHHYVASNTLAESKTSFSQHRSFATEQLSTGKAKQRPLFKGLQIGGASLEGFHPFQVKFVLQIAVHILGEIENTLGLPSVDRVGKKTDDKQPDVLGAGISPQLLKTVMRDNAAPGGRGGSDGSTVLAIRNRLSQLRKLLRGSINL
ncbi:C6 zinc finger domain protein [Penicillium herquei]|nr:C6 zinc finger domain protein [Penicillium herquei]